MPIAWLDFEILVCAHPEEVDSLADVIVEDGTWTGGDPRGPGRSYRP